MSRRERRTALFVVAGSAFLTFAALNREFFSGLLLGLCIGIVLGVAYKVWKDDQRSEELSPSPTQAQRRMAGVGPAEAFPVRGLEDRVIPIHRQNGRGRRA